MAIRWTEDEIRILDQYERTAKSAFTLYQEIRIAGYNRTYKAVTRKLESLGLRKPYRYTTGHEKTIGYLDIESTGFSANIDIMVLGSIFLLLELVHYIMERTSLFTDKNHIKTYIM